MEKSTLMSPITRHLLNWYRANKRDLPWRGITDPYLIWVSEIILQQTRVAQGWDYYTRFTRRFPNVHSLAAASEEEVLKIWQGLGYYSRARNMHAAALDITNRFKGKFPTRYQEILSLKGVGEYTAAAISSIAFNKPYAAVDGNVLRVFARLFAIEESIHAVKGKRVITEIVQSLLPPEDPASFNQAVMDFGALVCTPLQPECIDCPLQGSCMAYARNEVANFPVTRKKTKARKRYFNYFYIVDNGFTYITRREEQDIWKNLYEFPLVETPLPIDINQLAGNKGFRELFVDTPQMTIEPPSSLKHVLSHQIIHACFYRVKPLEEHPFNAPEHFIRVPHDQLEHYPVSRLIGKYLELVDDSHGELQKYA